MSSSCLAITSTHEFGTVLPTMPARTAQHHQEGAAAEIRSTDEQVLERTAGAAVLTVGAAAVMHGRGPQAYCLQ